MHDDTMGDVVVGIFITAFLVGFLRQVAQIGVLNLLELVVSAAEDIPEGLIVHPVQFFVHLVQLLRLLG